MATPERARLLRVFIEVYYADHSDRVADVRITPLAHEGGGDYAIELTAPDRTAHAVLYCLGRPLGPLAVVTDALEVLKDEGYL